MKSIFRFAPGIALAAVLGGFSAAAGAAPVMAGVVPAVATIGAAGPGEGLLQEVRWMQRCRPVTVYRRDRFGRPVRAVRTQCRRVWVGPGRRY